MVSLPRRKNLGPGRASIAQRHLLGGCDIQRRSLFEIRSPRRLPRARAHSLPDGYMQRMLLRSAEILRAPVQRFVPVQVTKPRDWFDPARASRYPCGCRSSSVLTMPGFARALLRYAFEP